MKGILFYDEAGAKRNAWFISRLIESARDNGCELGLRIINGVYDAVSYCDPRADFAIIRTISPEINEAIEKLGIPVFNNSTTAKIANDKWQTYLFAKSLGIPVMHTVSLAEGIDEDKELIYPRVIKTVDGHGGSEVFIANNIEECKEILSLHPKKHFISQELSTEPGIDMRVYVMGNDVIGAAKRTSISDFRSNFSLGGSATVDKPTDEMLVIIDKIKSSLNFDFVGIDFIRHNGKWVLNEIEDVVGTRMLYSLTDIDAAEPYVKYIINKIK
jgi:RimK family alpha-L-glutamate ligase